MDGEHQGPVAGVQLQEQGALDQVLGQVAQERDGPARQAARGHGRAQATGQNTAPRSGSRPIISSNEAGSESPKDQIWVLVLTRQQSGFSLTSKPSMLHPEGLQPEAGSYRALPVTGSVLRPDFLKESIMIMFLFSSSKIFSF